MVKEILEVINEIMLHSVGDKGNNTTMRNLKVKTTSIDE